jgi:hypothetical protein
MNAMTYAVQQIESAKTEDKRGNVAGRNLIVSRLKGDSDLPQKALTTMLKNAGLAK